MTRECVEVERIAEMLELPESDPVRRHLATCPRCASLVAAYESFLAADRAGAPEGTDVDDADARLMRFLEQRIGAPADAKESPEPTPRDGGFFSRLAGAFRPRPAWALAAAVAVVALVAWQVWMPKEPDHPVLRGTGELPLIEVFKPEVLVGGNVQIRWTVVEGAESYRVVLYDRELEEFLRLETGLKPAYTFSRKTLPQDAPRVAICRITALHDGDEIAESVPFPLRLP